MDIIDLRDNGGVEDVIFLSDENRIFLGSGIGKHVQLADKAQKEYGYKFPEYGLGAGWINKFGEVDFYGPQDGVEAEGTSEKKKQFIQAFRSVGIPAKVTPRITNWVKSAAQKNYNQLQYQRWQNQTYPNEAHGLPGDCINPKCDYVFTADDVREMEDYSGWFTCPNCGLTYNYLDESEKKYTRAGLTLDEMGRLGENIVEGMGEVPNVGQVTTVFGLKTNPIDAIIGPYGVEIKTNHSEAQARFKMGGENIGVPELKRAVRPKESKEYYCQQNGLIPALIGVRLNFYTDRADIFFREGMTDTWIGNKALLHVATVGFENLNPFKNPGDVPPASELPEDDSTPPSNIPF